MTREYLFQVMQDASFRVKDASAAAGVNRSRFHRLLRKHNVHQGEEVIVLPRYAEGTLQEAVFNSCRDYLRDVLKRSKTMSDAARLAGVPRQNFYRIARRFDVGQSINPAHRGCWHLYGL